MLDNYMRVPQTGDPTAYVGLAAAGGSLDCHVQDGRRAL